MKKYNLKQLQFTLGVRMKKKLNKVKKILGYCLVYLIITLGTAVGSLFLLTSIPFSESNGNKVTIAPQISKIYNNLSATNNIHLDLALVVKTDSEVTVNLDTDIKKDDQNENLQLQGNVELRINEDSLPIDFCFTGGNIYLEMCNAKFTFNTQNFSSSIEQILSSLGFSLSSLGLNVEDLSLESILGMLSDLKERVEKDVIILDINVPVVGAMQVVCDTDYNVLSLSMPQSQIENVTVGLDVGVSYPSNIEVKAPAEQYLDVSSMFEVLSSTLNYITNDKFGAKIDFGMGELNFAGNLYANLKEQNAKYEMELLGQNAKLLVLNKVLYIELGNLNFKFDLSSLPEALQILNTHFNTNLPVEFITDLLTKPKEAFSNLNLSQLLPGDQNSMLSDLDLSIIENFTQNGNNYTLTIKNIGQIEFVVNEGYFESLTFKADDLTINVTSIPARNIDLANSIDSYIDLALTLPAIDAAISTTEQNYIVAEGEMSIAGIKGDISLKADIKNSRLHLDLLALGKEISLDYLNGKAYINFDDVYLYGTKDDIASMLKSLGVEINPQTIIDALANWLDPQKNESFVKNIVAGDDSLTLNLLNNQTVTLYYDTILTGLKINLETTQISLNLSSATQIDFSPINEEQYLSANIILNKITKIYDYIKSKTYYIEIGGKTPLNTIEGFVNYSNGNLQANFNVFGDNNIFSLIVLDKMVYLTVNDERVSFLAQDFNDAVNVLQSGLTPDLVNIANKLDLNSILENILKATVLKIEQNNIMFAYKDLNLNVGFEGDNPRIAQIEGLDFNGYVKIQDDAHAMPQFDKSNFTPITTLIEKATSLREYITRNTHYLTVNATYKDIEIEGVLNHENESLSALLQLRSGSVAASLKLQNRTLFFDYNDLHISCKADELEGLFKLITEKIDANMTEILNLVIDNINFDSSLIDTILSNSKLKFNDDTLAFGFDRVLIEINFNQSMIKDVKLYVLDVAFTLNINSSPKVLPEVNEDDYLPLSSLMGKIESVLALVKSKQLYIDFTATNPSFSLNGNLNIDGTGITLSANAQIEGIELGIKLIDNIIYIEKENLKLQFNLDQIGNVAQFLKDEFNIDILSLISSGLDKINLANILASSNFRFEDNTLNFKLGDLAGQINFNENGLTGLNVRYNDIEIVGKVVPTKGKVEIKGKYTSIEELLPFVKAIKDYIYSRQYNISANANVYEKNTQIYSAQNMLLQLDLTGKIKFYANAQVRGVKNTKTEGFDLNLSASGDQSNIYVDYNSLALKVSQGDFEKIISVALKLFNMESLGGVAENLLNGQDIDIFQIVNIISQNTQGISPSYVNMLKKLDVEDNALTIVIDGITLSTNAKATQMEIVVYTNNGSISQISFKNFYTGVTHNEHFDFDVYFNEFNGVTAPNQNKNYIDLTGSSDLIEALINTISSNKTFEIKGYINIKLRVGFIDINWDISVNMQISLADGKLQMQAAIGAIPVLDFLVYNLNNDTPWSNGLFSPLSVTDRMLYIYFKDNYFYFYRHETNGDGDQYEKTIKAHIDSVLDDILYYVKWGTGFNDDVIGAIQKSLEASDNHTPNLNNIINSFSCPYQNNTEFYTLNLNLNELTGDDKMGNLEVGASIKNINGQNVIGGLSLNVDMPLIWGTTLYIKANPLTVSHGVDFNATTINKFEQGFKRGKESVEYSAENGNWTKTGERLYTITFVTGFDDISQPSISGSPNERFILPKYSDKVIGTNHPGIDYTLYSFEGWFTSENFAKGSEFKKGIIPAKNITLYGKWTIKEGYRTINYYNNGKLIANDYALVGSQLRSDIVDKYIEYEIDGILYKQEFIGWRDADGVTVEIVPEESENLYATYQTYQTLKAQTLTVVQGLAGETLTIHTFERVELTSCLPNYKQILLKQDGKTLVYLFKGWFVDSSYSTPAPSLMPSNNLTVYAKWEYLKTIDKLYKITIHDNDIVYSAYFEPNTPVVFPAGFPIYSNTRWYTDSEYTIQSSRPILMPECDLTFYIRNKYTITYTYYVLENSKFTAKTFSSSLYQGTRFTLQPLKDFEEVVREANIPIKRVGYYFQGYKTTDGKEITSNIVPNYDLTFSATYTTQSRSYHKLTFHCDWVDPAWWISSYDETSTRRTLDEMYVLEGSYIIGTTLYMVSDLNGTITQRTLIIDVSRKYIGVRYSFNSASWNTSGCKNLYNSAFGNADADMSLIVIDSNKDLYVEWQHI